MKIKKIGLKIDLREKFASFELPNLKNMSIRWFISGLYAGQNQASPSRKFLLSHFVHRSDYFKSNNKKIYTY